VCLCLCVPLSVIRRNKNSLDLHLQRVSRRGQTKKEWKKERKKDRKTVRKRVGLKYWDINQWFNFSLVRNKFRRLLFLCNFIGGASFILNEWLLQPLRFFPGTFSTFMNGNSMTLTDVEIRFFFSVFNLLLRAAVKSNCMGWNCNGGSCCDSEIHLADYDWIWCLEHLFWVA